MAFNLENNPLFAGTQPVQNPSPAAAAEPAAESAANPSAAPASEPDAEPNGAESDTTYVHATFIVRSDLLEKLKDYAFTERRQLKEVVNGILEEALERIEDEYKKQGRSLISQQRPMSRKKRNAKGKRPEEKKDS